MLITFDDLDRWAAEHKTRLLEKAAQSLEEAGEADVRFAEVRALLEYHGTYVDVSYDDPGLMEAAAMMILSGIKDTNMVQVLVADEMHMDLMDWVREFAAKFRLVYDEHPEIKQAIDSGHVDHEFIKRVTTLVQQHA